MFCIFSAAKILRNVTRSLVERDDLTIEYLDCTIDPGRRRNPITEALGSNHWAWRLTCGVCLEFFRDPIILPCGHSFCRRCILRIIDHVRMARQNLESEILKFRCPECRHGIKVNTSRNRFTANITARSVLAEWLAHFNSHHLIDRAVQTAQPSSQRSTSTQTTLRTDQHETQMIFTMKKKLTDSTDLSRLSAEIRNSVKIKSVSCCRSEKRKRTAPSICIPVLPADGAAFSISRTLDLPTLTEAISAPSDKASDYWGLYTPKNDSPNPQSFWVSPESDISKFGWFFNHTVFAFCVTMLCTDNKIDF